MMDRLKDGKEGQIDRLKDGTGGWIDRTGGWIDWKMEQVDGVRSKEQIDW